MKVHFSVKNQTGIALAECLVYIAILGLIMSLAMSAAFLVQKRSTQLQATCDNLAAAIRAGEQWRKDLRSSQEAQLIPHEQSTALILQTPSGEIHYLHASGAIWRKPPHISEWNLLLYGVARSEIVPEERSIVSSWRWELELLPARKHARSAPALSFIATTAAPRL